LEKLSWLAPVYSWQLFDQEWKEYLAAIEAVDGFVMVRDYLAEDGRLKNRITAVNAIDISRKATEDLIKEAREKGLNLLYKPTGGRSKSGDVTISPVLYVRADKDRLQECLSNLIENAIKYTPSGQIAVDVNASNEYIRFSVSDTGIGIPPEDIPHLFQKFYRVDNSDTREINGSGLGLSPVNNSQITKKQKEQLFRFNLLAFIQLLTRDLLNFHSHIIQYSSQFTCNKIICIPNSSQFNLCRCLI